MANENLKKSMEKLQMDAQHLMLQSGYNRSLERYHKLTADDLDSRLDVLGKKIRNLENQTPKEEKLNEPKQETIRTISEQPEVGTPEVECTSN